MDIRIILAWEWFQWIAIRVALFLALLTLGPSIGLIAFDLLLYAYRTTFERIPRVYKWRTTVVVTSEKVGRKDQTETKGEDVKVVVVETESVR
jgi:hypothetical protein